MDNLAAVKGLCNALCNTFYPDAAAIEVALFNEGLHPRDEAAPKDPMLLRIAVRLAMGYVEGSRSEGGVSAGVRSDSAVARSIRYWCAEYGLDADEIMGASQTFIDNASDLW